MYKYRRCKREGRKEKVVILLNILTIIILLSGIIMSTNASASSDIKEVIPEIQKPIIKYIVRSEINDKISSNKDDHMKYLTVINFYSQYTNNWEISKVILEEALTTKVPVNLAFSLAAIESSFNPKAYNKNNNGTADRGLFQLNDSYRQSWTIEEFYDIALNTKEGINYLLYCIENTNSIPDAFGAYNAGLSRVNNLPEMTKKHIEKILVFENKLDYAFNQKIMENL